MRYIGDVHAKFELYQTLLSSCLHSIQVGDFGAGFVTLPNISINHRFIRGNHDNPAICRKSPNWIPDVTYEDETFFLGGAYSIDQSSRTIGKDWWDDEELSHQELSKAIDLYEVWKPRIVVTHDAPQSIMRGLFPYSHISSRTANALDAMFDIHKPELWIFGHFHRDIAVTRNGTKFICLAEFSYIDI